MTIEDAASVVAQCDRQMKAQGSIPPEMAAEREEAASILRNMSVVQHGQHRPHFV